MENREIKALYMGWYESDPQQWVPIQRISWDGEGNYYHSYTEGFEANYEKLRSMIFNPDAGYKKVWHLKQLNPELIDRTPHREDNLKLYDLLGIPEAKAKRDTIVYLSRALARRNNDYYDYFPEVTPNEDGNYEFYFLLLGLVHLVGSGVQGVKEFADNLTGDENLTVAIEENKTKVFFNELHVGHCPDYIHFFLTNCEVKSVKLRIEQINQDTYYGGRILVKCSIKPSVRGQLYSHRLLKPLNEMVC